MYAYSRSKHSHRMLAASLHDAIPLHGLASKSGRRNNCVFLKA